MIHFRINRLKNPVIAGSLLILSLLTQSLNAQVIWSSPTGTQWLNGSNWTGGAVPTAGQIAQFNANPASATAGIGINMDTAAGAVSVGAIYLSSARNANLIIGNSALTTPGTLSLTGATVTVSNTILANFASSNARLTIQNTQGAGGSTLALAIGSGINNILTETGTSTGIGNSIIISSIINGAGGIHLLGGGTWDAASATGSNGGLLKLAASNTFTGGITAGNNDGTSNGIVELDSAGAISNVTGNDITVNPNSQLYLAAPGGSTYTASNITLTLNGLGNNYTTTGRGALVNLSGSSYTWDGAVVLASDAAISVLGTTTTSVTVTGSISGSGQLIKVGTGNLILSGNANSWAGGTIVNSGKLTVSAGSSLSTGPLAMNQQAIVNPFVVLNNTTQVITSLSSSFALGSSTNTLTLNGTRLTINQNTNTEFGGSSSALTSIITGTGSVVKTGTGTLKLTSPNNTFSGGLTIVGGKIKFNPSNGTTQNNTSPDTLAGGTFSTDSISRPFTFNLGTLALTENSAIELGSDTTHFIKFSASSGITWVSGKILTITHWAGAYNGTSGTKGRLYIGSGTTGLTSAQLAQIRFDDGAGHSYNATQLATGEIVPAAPVITTTTAAYGPFCNNTSTTISVPFTTTGPFSGTFSVQLSNAAGTFPADFTSNIIGTGTSSPITAVVSAGLAAGTAYRLRVINPTPTPTFGSNNGANITITGTPAVAAITGPSAIANGGTAAYTDASTGGTWSSSDPTVATVSATGTVSALSLGTTTLSYAVTNSCGITGFATKVIAVVAVPSVTAVSPLRGTPGTTVTITGTNFNATATDNVVYFGATRAAVSAGSATSLTVMVPAGATYGLVAVIDTITGLSAFSPLPFTPTYTNTGLIPNAVNFKPAINFTTGANPVGLAIGDLDGDGKPDMVVSNSGPNTIYVYRNTSTTATAGVSTFASPVSIATGAGPYYVKIADLDGDGRPDIIVANTSASSNRISIFRNTSATGISFAARVDFATGGSAPTDISIADFDNDGKPDIAVVNQGSSKVAVLRNVSSLGSITTTSFSTAVSYNTGFTPFKIFSGDLDGDGLTDMAVTNFSSNTVSLFHNNGTTGVIAAATFATATTLTGSNAPTGIAGGDIDGDGKTDLLVTNSGGGTISVYRNTNTTAGTFSFASNVDFAAGTAPEDIALSDIDGDGKLDAAVGNYTSNTLSIFRNTASSGSITTSSFSAHVDYNTGSNPSGIALADIDGDGKPDVTVANGGSATVSLFRNYPLPPVGAITGADSICMGSATAFSNSVSGGTWVSTNPAIATISNTGSVTTITPGLDTIIYYTVAQGDTNMVFHPLTVDAHVTVGAITAAAGTVCIGALLPLSDAVPTGRWSSSDTTIATVNTTGFVSGRAVGNAIITYTISNTCGTSADTFLVTVSPSSGYVIGAISGAPVVCAGAATTFTDTTSGGQWSSSDATIARVNAAGAVTGVTHGTAIISYGFTSACGTYIATKPVSVDTLLIADSITAPASICNGSSIMVTDAAGSGGTWTVSNAHATINVATGVLSAVSAGVDTIIYTITNTCGTVVGRKAITINPLPFATPVTGAGSVCPADTIFLASAATGGTWRLTNTRAVISATGRLIGTTAGIDTVLYIITNSCGSDTAKAAITILPLPNPGTISGSAIVCIGSSITLRDTVAGGTWSSINSNATVIDSVVTGVTAGTDTIKFTLTNSCGTVSAIKKITINPYPFVDTITGPSVVCTGSTITLEDATAGGIWSRTNSHANINTAGLVTGVTSGLDTVKYTVTTNGCASVASKEITVLQLTAGAILSPVTVCVGASITLRDTIPGGTWTGTNHFSTLTDTLLTGVSAGADTIVYAVTSTCGTVYAIKRITVNPQPDAGKITGANIVAVGDTIILKDSVSGGLWAVNNNNALISITGVLGGLKEGADTVFYVTSNSCGKDTVTFPVTVAASTKPGTIVDLQLYPNPNRGNFDFTVVSKIDEAVTIVLSNSVYQAFDLFQVATNVPNSLKLDYLANGVYFLSAISAQGWHTVKFVIAR